MTRRHDGCLQGTNLRKICPYSTHHNPDKGVNIGSVMVISLYMVHLSSTAWMVASPLS